MTTIEFESFVDKDRELSVTLPKDFPIGKVRVTIEVTEDAASEATDTEDVPWEDRPWTKEEIAELMKSNPMTLGEILQSESVGSWADLGIEDSQAWVENVRRQEAERRRWPRE